jgi:hypothetical protein
MIEILFSISNSYNKTDKIKLELAWKQLTSDAARHYARVPNPHRAVI